MKKVIKANRFAQEVQMIKQRFLDINEGKLQRLITGLSRKQSPFLQVLPLLFHVNHPALPGYQSKQVAKGIQHYKPNKAALSAVPGGAQRFDLFSRPVLNADILALYIMGSCGTLAQGVRSDLDIWLVHAPDLSEEALGLLQQKAQLIEKWAKKYNLEVHFFLMDPQAFKGGQVGVLSDEDSGSSQHHLLLDEFYRSCILLAGCYPVWWLVPPEQEQNYEAYLLQLAQQAHLGYKETIDFGALPKVPHQEVVGAALWQLHKGVHSPYKSILKLMLLQCYVLSDQQYPCLSLHYKSLVYQQQVDLDLLDPYYLLYQRLEMFLLQRNQLQRLELVRRCFYYKLAFALTKVAHKQASSWRRQRIEWLCQSWQWEYRDLATLDSKQHWSIGDLMKEKRLLVKELLSGYRLLAHFTKQKNIQQSIAHSDLSILGRRLFSAFERRMGKIDSLSLTPPAQLRNEYLALIAESDPLKANIWGIHEQDPDRRPHYQANALKRSESLLELITWAYVNQLASSTLLMAIRSHDAQMDSTQLREVLLLLQRQISLPLAKLPPEHFAHANEITQVLVFVNLGQTLSGEPLVFNTASNAPLLSASSINSIELLMLNSWNEITVKQFIGESACALGIQFCLNQLLKKDQSQVPMMFVEAFGVHKRQLLAQQVHQLFQQALTTLWLAETESRFLLAQQQGYCLLSRQNKQVASEWFYASGALLWHLQQPLPAFSPLYLDAMITHKLPDFAAMLAQQHAGRVSVFLRITGQRAVIYLLDEQACLLRFTDTFNHRLTLLQSLYHFLLRVEQHQLQHEKQVPNLSLRQYVAFEILGERKDKQLYLAPMPLNEPMVFSQSFEVSARVYLDKQAMRQVSVYIDQEEFHTAIDGEQVYQRIANWIVHHRAFGSSYNVYLNDVQLSSSFQSKYPHQTAGSVQYFKQKNLIEQAINKAMSSVSP